jgi:hypothetical protein
MDFKRFVRKRSSPNIGTVSLYPGGIEKDDDGPQDSLHIYTRLHDINSQEMILFVVKAVGTSNFIWGYVA